MRPTPQLSVKTWGGGYWQLGQGGGSQGGGGLRATHYYHMHTSRVCVCVWGAWGYRGMYAIIAISRLCREESLKGLKDQRHRTPSTKHGTKNWAPLASWPPHRYLSKLGGGGVGWGGSHKRTGPGRPPPPVHKGPGEPPILVSPFTRSDAWSGAVLDTNMRRPLSHSRNRMAVREGLTAWHDA